MKVEFLDTNKIVPYKDNPRVHSDIQIEQISKSIKEFGFTVPILIDENKNVIAGHGRLEASKLLKLKEVPTITIGNLTDQQKKAYIIADNQLTLNSNWNEDLLKSQLSFLTENNFDLNLLGFEDAQLDNYFKEIEEIDLTDDFKEFDEEIETQHQCPKCGFKWSGKVD